MLRIRVAILAVLLASGCGERVPMGEVEGVLTKNGKPLAGVQVQFLPDPESGTRGPRSVGFTDAEGRYRLRCDDGKPGAIAGTHVVCLLDAAERLSRLPKAKAAAPSNGPRFSSDFGSASRTAFQKIAVVEGVQQIDLDVANPTRR